MIPRHNLRTVFYFCSSLLLLSAFAILIAEKVPSNNNENLATSMSLGFFSMNNSNSSHSNNKNNILLLQTLPFTNNNNDRFVSYLDGCAKNNNDSGADFILTLIALGFGYAIVFPTYIGVYLNSDVRSDEALLFAKRLSVLCAVVTCLFSFGLLLPLIIVSIEITKNANSSSSSSTFLKVEWPWAILVVSFLLVSLIFVPWSIYRAKIIDNVKLDFPEQQNNNNKSHEPMAEEEEQQGEQLKQQSRRGVYIEAAAITFYKTRGSMGKLLLLLVCILAIFTSSVVSSYAWFSFSSASSQQLQVHSALFGSCTVNYVSNLSSVISNNNNNFAHQENNFVDLYRGLNGTSLAFAVFLLMGAALQWTWCLVPLSLIGGGFSAAIIGFGVDEMKEWNNNNNQTMIELNWLFWLQVGAMIVWILTAIGGVLIQLCVKDAGAEEDDE